MSLRVTLIQGGGIGFDQAPAVQSILEAAGVDIDWEEHLAGLASIEKGGPPLPEAMLSSVRRNGLALKTKLLSPAGPPDGNWNVQFRRQLGLFACSSNFTMPGGVQLSAAMTKVRLSGQK